MSQQTIRPYIMALYTLQDEFKAILEAPSAEGIGKTFDSELTLKDDGTQELKFSIPMYIREHGVLKENPSWYSIHEENLIVGMRKIKVIFGNFPDEALSPLDTMIASEIGETRTLLLDGVSLFFSIVDSTQRPGERGGRGLLLSNDNELAIYEFVITKVIESHKDGILTCEVECEGLAFQELGKTGYKLSLNQDSYDIDYRAYYDGIIADVSPFYSHIGTQIDTNDTTGYSLDLIFKEKSSTIQDAGAEDLYTACDQVDVKLKIDTGAIVQTDKRYTLKFFCTKNCDSRIQWKFENGNWNSLQEENILENIQLTSNNIQYVTIAFKKNNVDVSESVPVISSFTLKQQEEVIANINYWMDKVVDGTDWTYEIQTNWAAYDGEFVEDYDKLSDYSRSLINESRERQDPPLRRMDKMYEDEYVSSWDDDAVPSAFEVFTEKQRIIDCSESNRYNITQDIAEKFEVNCKYEYVYDTYFRIIGKKIIFFNNFIKDRNAIDITYPYDTNEVSRELDCKDIVTKMYVKSVDDDTNLVSGKISIIDSPSNRSKEDYILNFDYMHDIGSITDEQYAEIDNYEKAMRQFNINMEQKSNLVSIYSNAIVKEEAKVSYYTNAATEANDRVKEANRKLKAILGDDNTLKIENGYSSAVLNDDNGSYITIYKSGIDTGTLEVYTSRTKDANSKIAVSIRETTENYTKVNLSFSGVEPTSYVYSFFEYNPYLYYTELVRIYSENFRKAQEEKKKAEDNVKSYKTIKENAEIELASIKKEKEARVGKFERLMGPAIREGNWQDEEYRDMGNKYTSLVKIGQHDFILGSSVLGETVYNRALETEYCLDEVPFDDEQKPYVEYGVNKDKMYYPYIIVEPENFTNYTNIFLSYNDYWVELSQYNANGTINSDWTSAGNAIWNSSTVYSVGSTCYVGTNKAKRYKSLVDNNKGNEPGLKDTAEYYGINSQLVPAVLKINGEYKTVLLITDESLIKTEIKDGETTRKWDISNIEGKARFVKITSDITTKTEDKSADWVLKVEDFANATFLGSDTVDNKGFAKINLVSDSDEIVICYPRVKIKNMLIKTGDSPILYIGENAISNKLLEQYEDYTVLPRYSEVGNEDDEAYCLSIRPIVFLEYGVNPVTTSFIVTYSISNAATSMYLDAKKISKENAYPQVSYEVSINAIQDGIVTDLYARLDQICHINDSDLKFKNVSGYISEIEMQLDKPWEDKITIKNYRSKFEDLFSSIVASTEAMKTNEPAYSRAANCFLTTGELKEEVISNSISSNNITYSFDNGNLTIDETNGICATSKNGVVAMRGTGISIASEKNASGEWVWQNGIAPDGINASLISAGQLNLEKIFIYAGDNVSYQMNSSGLYAYRQNGNTTLTSEYVVHNGEGLFLVNKAGTHIFTDDNGNTGTVTLSDDINRVEISWNGLIIRNTNNEKVFYADTEGNLTLSGVINAKAGNIGDWMIFQGGLVTKNMSAGIIPNNTNGDVIWVTGNEDYFSVDSNGIVTATSLILQGSMLADEATVNGVPLTAVIAQVGIGEGIFYTPLLGNVFSKDNDLKYAITKYRVDIEYDDMIDKIVVQAKSKNEEDEDIYIDIDSSCYDIEFDGGNYLTIILHRSIMNEAESGVFRFAMDYDGNEYATSDLELSMISDGEAYTVYIESDSGNILRNYEGAKINLTARVYLNGEEVKEDKFTYKWFKNKDEIKDKWIKNGSEVEEGTEDAEKVNNHAKTISINELDIYSCEVEVN